MPNITLSITAIELKVLSHILPDPEYWLRNAIKNRARKAADWCIIQYTTTNPVKLSDQEKVNILDTLELPPHPPETD